MQKSGRELLVIVAGVMSGTSADGIDVALVRVQGRGFRSRLELLAHYHFPYPAEVRRAVLQAMNAQAAKVADLARLNFALGELYAKAVQAAQRRAGLECALVGCHGQTLYHQGAAALYLGSKVACTWQTGEGAIVAQRVGVPVVSDFRPADMAAGGHGRAVGSLPRLRAVSASAVRADCAEHRRDWEFDGDSSAGKAGGRHGVRYRAGQHGDGCGGGAVV